MKRAQNKAERLIQVENLLLAHPEGLTQAEIARRLHVDRSTINRYVADIPKHIYIEFDGRWKIDRTADLINVRLNLHEALAVHLASRLLATRMDRQNPHAASALRKLGVAMQRWAERISLHVLKSADVMDEAAQRKDPGYLRALEQLTLGWAEQRKVQVWHYSEKADKVFEYLFSPYFIEPYAVGQTTHVIGLSEPPGALRTLKIERIERVEATQDAYEISSDFDPRDLLAHAWGVWYTENEPVEVTLKFHPRVAGRVRETRWHRSEQETELLDGSILWKASVAEPQEMLPWIRGWGADVEVLEPEGLRKALVREARRLAGLYEVAKMKKELIAHVREKDGTIQTLEEHLSNVSKLAGEFAAKMGLKESGVILGLLHDVGKASEAFQNYIGSATGLIKPDAPGWVDYRAKKGKIDHSTAGAQVIYKNLQENENKAAQALALCIASHHSGLIDCLAPNGENTFQRRIGKVEGEAHAEEAWAKLTEIERKISELVSNGFETQLVNALNALKALPESRSTLSFKHGLLVRYLLSCLIDADRLDTADFEFPSNQRIRNYSHYRDWDTLIKRLDIKLLEFENKPDKNEVDDLREEISQACLDLSGNEKGIYQLTVPTGGGKTLSSLRFALNHAKAHGMERIFYIIPYTSIIDQNAKEVRKILEDKDKNGRYLYTVVLEHHSNLAPDDENGETGWLPNKRRTLLSENWDAPIVFTTQVQFLEALFGSGTRGVRRMHQLANSVIIFDEVQTIPIRLVKMFNSALEFFVHGGGSSVVLCTATQPLLDRIEPDEHALSIDGKIIENEKTLYEKLRRVEVYDKRKDSGSWSNIEVAALAQEELAETGSVLIVVNTKSSAKSLYDAISTNSSASVYHLSTKMCPAHRLDVLDDVRTKLDEQEPVICVSTQLIEAGVDIDFGTVIRYEAGLDSVAQAAGRCNRSGRQKDKDGKKTLGHVYIVNPAEERIDRLKEIKEGIRVTGRVLREFQSDPEQFENDRLGLKTMERYYKYYFYERKDEMAYSIDANSSVGRSETLYNLLSQNTTAANRHAKSNGSNPFFTQAFQAAANEFEAIDSPSRGVIAPYKDKGKELVNEFCGAFALEKQYQLIKKAQRYSINMFPHEFQKMVKAGSVKETQEGSGIFYLDAQYYSEEYGWSEEIVNNMETLIG